MVTLFGTLEFPGEASYWLTTLMYLLIYFGVFVYTQIISFFGYDGATKMQSSETQLGIRLATGLIPALMIALGLFFLSKYPIDKDKEDEIETEILDRHRAS